MKERVARHSSSETGTVGESPLRYRVKTVPELPTNCKPCRISALKSNFIRSELKIKVEPCLCTLDGLLTVGVVFLSEDTAILLPPQFSG